MRALLLILIVSFSARADPDDLRKVTSDTIHSEYAIEAVRTVTFTLSPDEAVARFREAGYSIVPAPDGGNSDHPQLFYVTATYTIGIREGETVKSVHPTISVVVHQNGISLTYRVQTSNGTNAAKYEFCNSWNFRYHASTCFVDKQGKYNLQNDVQFMTEMGPNKYLVDEAMQFFQRSLTLFAKKIVAIPVLEKSSKSADL